MLGGLYLLWMWPRAGTAQRARLLGAHRRSRRWSGRSTDAIVTGDPLHSLHGTADLAEAVDRRRDIVDAPYWTAQYFGYSAARAARDRDPGRALLRLALPPPRGAAAARRRRGDDARVHDRAALRAAADRPLRAHAVGPADAVLRARRVRLAARSATRGRGGCWMWIGHRHAPALSIAFLPWHVGMLARPRAPPRPRRRDVRRAARRPPARRPSGARSRHAAGASRPPTTGRSRTCAGGSAPTRARVGTRRGRRQPAARTCCCCRAASR